MRYALILALALSTAAFAGETQTIDRTFDLKPGGEVNLRNVNGNVVVQGWDKNQVRIVAVKKARGSRALQKLENIEVRIEATSNLINVETVKVTKMKTWNNVSVKYELWVPNEVDLNARTTNGNVSISEITGTVMARSTNGNVKAEQVAGNVNASSTNGNVTAELIEYTGGDMSLKTTNGSIRFSGPRDMNLDVDAKTTNGSINTDFAVASMGKISKRHLNGTINNGGNRLTLKTTNGSIKLREY
ncbi:MAG: DUF4097 family beta strand repeat-containing protein [Acidobacteriota bacterium]|nr:DUF4097 family beta strand repeat-containing protein [Acidobacteriota bacterium]